MEVEILFQHAPLTIAPVAGPLRETGACVEFLGIVRALEHGKVLSGLHYEAYEPMAHRQLRRIFAQLPHPVQAVVFQHRLGWVPVGETSLFVRVLAAHRAEAFAFCSAAIDLLKTDVPIWKRV